ncbi:MAG TPA: NAD(P)H-dependent oxidoreductase [Pirellulaceae bacterium]|nr:NAD(P)H-dependent oxidoreductase [Pirellulaceae bacterium]
MNPRLLLINASLAGPRGNSAVVLERIARSLASRATLDTLVLAERSEPADWERAVRGADGFVIATGTYWDNWSSHLQQFLERLTSLEATDLWLGKPAAVLVSMHSVGGKEVVSRLQGILNTLGLQLPPLTGWAYSAASHFALDDSESDDSESEAAAPADDPIRDGIRADLWRIDDLEIVAHNLLQATIGGRDWRAWSVDRTAFGHRWIEPTRRD